MAKTAIGEPWEVTSVYLADCMVRPPRPAVGEVEAKAKEIADRKCLMLQQAAIDYAREAMAHNSITTNKG